MTDQSSLHVYTTGQYYTLMSDRVFSSKNANAAPGDRNTKDKTSKPSEEAAKEYKKHSEPLL